MINDVLQYICNYVNQHCCICITKMTKYVDENFIVSKLCSKYISQKSLSHHKFSKLKILNIDDNKSVNNIDHLAGTLVELYCRRSYISQKNINKLKYIRVLHGNAYINDVSHLRDHIEDISDCNIDQNQLRMLHKIKNLSINYNPNITNLFHLRKTLTKLECCGSESGIGQKALDELENLCVLKCDRNKKIVDVNKLSHCLKELHCKSSNIKHSGLSKLAVLEILSTDNTICKKDISSEEHYDNCYDITHISKYIREIECRYIDQSTLNETLKLEKLVANPHCIEKLVHLRETLTHLDFGHFPIEKKLIRDLYKLKSPNHFCYQ